MHLAKTMRLDISDKKIFPNPAEPGEWAIAGTFSYLDIDYGGLDSKEKIAYKSGWLGLSSFGQSTLVCVTVITEFEIQQITHKLAEHIFNEFEAPNMLAALDAARHEISDMSALCDHPTGTLLAIGREFDEIGIREQVGKIQSSNGVNHARIWEITPEEA
jgi:hypothetical protein